MKSRSATSRLASISKMSASASIFRASSTRDIAVPASIRRASPRRRADSTRISLICSRRSVILVSEASTGFCRASTFRRADSYASALSLRVLLALFEASRRIILEGEAATSRNAEARRAWSRIWLLTPSASNAIASSAPYSVSAAARRASMAMDRAALF